ASVADRPDRQVCIARQLELPEPPSHRSSLSRPGATLAPAATFALMTCRSAHSRPALAMPEHAAGSASLALGLRGVFLRRFQDAVKQFAGVRFVEGLGYPCGGVGSLWRAGIGLEPVAGSEFGDVTELRDEHREMSAPAHVCRSAGLPVGVGERAGPARVGVGELEK